MSQDRLSVASNSGPGSNKGLDQLFPTPVNSLKGSLSFAKNFTLLALSMISYSRGMFPIDAYSEKHYKGHAIKILSGRGGTSEEARLVWKWMKSACRALEDGYMRELVFEVISVEGDVVEFYTIEYGYDENNIKCKVNISSQTIAEFDHASFQAAFINLFTKVASFVRDLEPLPAAYRLQLRINYYEKTPEDYIPDYFRDELLDPKRYKWLCSDSMGSLNTPFHLVTLKMASALKRKVHGEETPDQNSQKRMKGVTQEMRNLDLEQTLMSQNEDKENNATHSSNDPKETVAKSILDQKQLPQPQQLEEFSQQNVQCEALGHSGLSTHSGPGSSGPTKSTSTLKKSNSHEFIFAKDQTDCICGLNDHSTVTFACFYCRKTHHLVCYKRKPTSTVNPTDKYACFKCALEDENRTCLDPAMATKKNAPLKTATDLAVYRKVTFRLQWFSMINAKILRQDFNVSEEQAGSIISKLQKMKMLRPNTRSGDYTLNANRLIAFVNSYFK